jgi:hypothetical protein
MGQGDQIWITTVTKYKLNTKYFVCFIYVIVIDVYTSTTTINRAIKSQSKCFIIEVLYTYMS